MSKNQPTNAKPGGGSAPPGKAGTSGAAPPAKAGAPASGSAPAAKAGGGPPSTRLADSAIANLKLEPCKYCKRKFAGDRLAAHEQICESNKNKKSTRKSFDSAKHRLSGTVAENYKKPQTAAGASEVKPANNWRQKHEELIQSVKSAKAVDAHLKSGGNPADLPPLPPSDYSDYVECPYCGRRFNQNAAERHIPACENMVHNKTGNSSKAPVKKPGGK